MFIFELTHFITTNTFKLQYKSSRADKEIDHMNKTFFNLPWSLSVQVYYLYICSTTFMIKFSVQLLLDQTSPNLALQF